MKKILISFIVILSFSFIWFMACENDVPSSIYDPDDLGEATPAISSITPADSTTTGIGNIVISGSNFSPVAEENLVFFNKTRAKVVSSTENEIIVESPIVVGDSVAVKVSVRDSYHFSNDYLYSLFEAVYEFGGFDDYTDPYALAVDNDENLYVSIAGKKIEKVSPDGTRETYANVLVDKCSGMVMGPNGDIYYANILQYIFLLPAGGGQDGIFVRTPGGVQDLDFDANGNIFCGGNGKEIYWVNVAEKTSTTVKEYPSINIKSIRVFNGYVYVVGDYVGTEQDQVKFAVYRNQILDAEGTLGETEMVFAFSNEFPTAILYSVNFDIDGIMYLGTSMPDKAILKVQQDGSYSVLYPRVMDAETYEMCWGNGNHMYITRRNKDVSIRRVLKLNMFKQGAPYYGRQ